MPLKSHQTYQNQLALYRERGLTFGSETLVLEVLKSVGYYRFSAYTYPFRKPFYDSDHSLAGRLDEFDDNANFEDALKLYDFDKRLRSLLQEALEAIEVAFCAHVSYVLGRRSPDAHEVICHLDADIAGGQSRRGNSRHAEWLARFAKLKGRASGEDYVKHHKSVYGDRMPIWVATEFLDFGSVVRLFEMMKTEDQIEIARNFCISNDQHGLMLSWMMALTDLRNRCAHNNRVWNRVSKSPKKPSARMILPDFQHMAKLTERQKERLYGVVSVVAYLIRAIESDTSWPARARQLFQTFGDICGMTLETTLGFPAGWDCEKLWESPQRQPPETPPRYT